MKRERKADGTFTAKHGMTGTRLHNIWMRMLQRCEDKNCCNYHRYGGRGILVCEEWHEFVPFMEWAFAVGYNDSLSIDRMDVNGNYEPSNCRWSTEYEKQNNRRNNIRITIDRQTRSLAEWAREYGMNYAVVYARFKRGIPIGEIFDRGDRRYKR